MKILEEARAGIAIDELCRKYGVSKGSFYNWKVKFGDLTVSEARWLKNLEAENTKLKRLVADQALDIIALKDVVSRKR